jgi:16S rRNA (cytosine967-C5)-methyltransferase
VATARQIAFDILMAVEGTGYASDLLAARCTGLDSRDAGLASSIVLGVLRYRPQLDYLIAHFSGRSAKLDPEVRNALRMGIFQLRYLDRIPAHAAVGESVELIKRAHKRSATGFANAVLRKVTRDPVPWPDRETELCIPAWMLRRWEARFGQETAEGIARAALVTPVRYIRVPAGAIPPADAQPTDIPGCYRAEDAGGFRIQDIGSQSVVPLLDLHHSMHNSMRFLDVCAAPGNKTAQALESGVDAIACDIHLSRLQHLTGLNIPLVQLNAEQPLPFGQLFDRILVDAPCSGTGTLAHNPEIKWRLREDEISTQQTCQRHILENASKLLKPGGLLVYSTCSLEYEENEAVTGGRARETMQRLPGQQEGDGFYAAVIPRENFGTDSPPQS